MFTSVHIFSMNSSLSAKIPFCNDLFWSKLHYNNKILFLGFIIQSIIESDLQRLIPNNFLCFFNFIQLCLGFIQSRQGMEQVFIVFNTTTWHSLIRAGFPLSSSCLKNTPIQPPPPPPIPLFMASIFP